MPKYQIQVKGFLTLYHGAAGESIARIRALRVSSNHPELTAEVMKARLHGGAEHSSNFKAATSRLPPSTRRLPRGYKGVYLVTIVAEYEDTKHEWAVPNYTKCRRLSMQPIKQSYHCSERHWKTSFAKHRKYMGVLRDALVRLANRQIAGNLGEWTGDLAVETITAGKHRIDVVSSQHNNRLVTLEGSFDGMVVGMYERDQLIDFLANNDAMSNMNNLFTAYQYVGGQMVDDVINWVALNKRPVPACGFAYGQETTDIQMTDHPTTTEDGVVLDPALAAKLNFHTYDTRVPMENVKYTDPRSGMGPIVKIDGEGV